MPIYKGDNKLFFEQVEEYDDNSNVCNRVLMLFSQDPEITVSGQVQELFVKQMYSPTDPDLSNDIIPSTIRFDSNYKSLKAKYRSCSAFLYNYNKIITSFKAVEMIVNIPAKADTEDKKIDLIKKFISNRKLSFYRDPDRKEGRISSIIAYSMEHGWIKLEIDSRLNNLDQENDLNNLLGLSQDDSVSNEYDHISEGSEVTLISHPLGILKQYVSKGFVKAVTNKNAKAFLGVLPGSTGAPVFDSNNVFVGIYTGIPFDPNFTKNNTNRYSILTVDIDDHDAYLPEISLRNVLKI